MDIHLTGAVDPSPLFEQIPQAVKITPPGGTQSIMPSSSTSAPSGSSSTGQNVSLLA